MVSSRDVAKLAGVSQTTVSRVINGSPLVKPKTIEKVEKAIQQLQFQPNLIARSLVSNKTNTIALITGSLHNPFYAETTTSIVNIAAQRGYHVIVHFQGNHDRRKLYDTVISQRVDGIIMSTILLDDDIYDKLNQLSLPFVTFNRKHRLGGNFVEMDNIRACEMAVDYLVSLGHKNIAFIGGPTISSTFLDRQLGFEKACSNHQIAVGKSMVQMANTESAAVKQACRDLLRSGTGRPSAVIAVTDAIALTCLDYFLSEGVSVPNQISLVGIDNIQWSSHRAFQLSTVGAISEQNMGEIAIHRLLDMIEAGDHLLAPSQIQLEPCLFARKTSGLLADA